ncbi:MAG: hypothetical protein ACI9KA_001070 [Parasphingorhabdus sp.]|jgi:hypothetical protein|uniref:hypothetical protein n=1 Tax=Parasphingorhabdus sp. TaxID=2709688 RepID=UPI0039E4074F
MSIFENSMKFDDFAEEVCASNENLETEIWSYGLPGLISMIRAFVRNGHTDQSRLVDTIHGLSEVFSHGFIEQFIDHLTGHHPDIHVLHEDNEGKLVLIEKANL